MSNFYISIFEVLYLCQHPHHRKSFSVSIPAEELVEAGILPVSYQVVGLTHSSSSGGYRGRRNNAPPPPVPSRDSTAIQNFSLNLGFVTILRCMLCPLPRILLRSLHIQPHFPPSPLQTWRDVRDEQWKNTQYFHIWRHSKCIFKLGYYGLILVCFRFCHLKLRLV